MSSVRRPRVARQVTWATVAVLAGVVLAGCTSSTDSEPRPTAAPTGASDDVISLEDVDTTALVVPRGPFCDRVDPAAVTRALGEEAAEVSAYRSGQRIKISDDVADVVHEFGCQWTAGDSSAEAWVFAPPITRKRAAAMVGSERARSECLDYLGPDFGRPSASCASIDDSSVAVRFRGLFGDAWLTCSLTLPRKTQAQVDARASRWCAAAATGAATAG